MQTVERPITGARHSSHRGGSTPGLALAIRTCRVFRQIDGRGKQVHQHGSIEAPELLARHLSAVPGRH